MYCKIVYKQYLKILKWFYFENNVLSSTLIYQGVQYNHNDGPPN